MLKTILAFALLSASIAFGQETGTVKTQVDLIADLRTARAENDFLKAQLAQLRIEFTYQLQLCQMPDLMRAKLAVQEAEAKKAALPQPAQRQQQKEPGAEASSQTKGK